MTDTNEAVPEAAIENAETDNAAKPKTGQQTFTREEVDQMIEVAVTAATKSSDNGTKIYSQEEVDQIVEKALTDRATQDAAETSKKGKVKAFTVPLGMDLSGVISADVIKIVPVDGDMCPIAALPPLSFGPKDFAVHRSGVTLVPPIDYPLHGAGAEVNAYVLLDGKGKGVAVCQLLAPITVGGGRVGRHPPRSLLFRTD